jgi:fermentation-respiration switch protein FrsA (DUF1100 family)
MKNKFTKSGILLVVSLPCLLSGCGWLVNRLSFFPDTSFAIPQNELPLNVKVIFITTGDKKKCQSLYIKNDTARYCCIYFHGNGGNIFHRVPELLRLQQCGVSVLGIGYRGYAKSSGRPSEKGIYQDGRAALKYASDTLGFPLERIFLCGRSIGTTVAVELASNATTGGLLLVTPLTSGKEYALAHGLDWLAFIAGDRFDNLGKCVKINCPVLVIHGTGDEIVPYQMGETVMAKLSVSNKHLVTIKNGRHNDLEFIDSTTYWKSIQDFVSENSH